MSMRNVEYYNKKIGELPWDSKEREKYIDLLYAELIKIAPKLIYDKLKGFELRITSKVGLNPDALSRALYRYFDEAFEEGMKVFQSKDFYIITHPVVYDVDVYYQRMKMKEYLTYFEGNIELELSFTPEEVPLKWKIDSVIKNDQVYKVTIHAV